LPGATDVQVIELAVGEDRILLTEDKDFGRSIARRHIDPLFRPGDPDVVAGRLHAWLAERRNVLIHCTGGLGRSGMIAARLMVELGEEPRLAMQRVRAARPGAIEAAAQEACVRAWRAGTAGGPGGGSGRG